MTDRQFETRHRALREYASAAPFAPPARPPQYDLAPGRAAYQATWQGRPYEFFPTPETQNTAKQCVDQGFDLWRGGPWTFNYAVRRQPCMLVSGDLPRVGLVETLSASGNLNPPFTRYGDLRVRLRIGNDAFWLDERGAITARYHPWGTAHRVDLQPEYPLTVELTAALAEDSGIVVSVKLEGRASVVPTVELYVGGLDQNMTQYWPEYLRVHAAGYPWHLRRPVQAEDRVTCGGNTATFANPEIPCGSSAATWPATSPAVCAPDLWAALNHVGGEESLRARLPGGCRPESRVVFRQALVPGGDPVWLVLWKTGDPSAAALVPERAPECLMQAQRYYRELLAPYVLETPDAALNAAFDAALVNLDYGYHAPAWFEGLHEWNGYFSVNYQISAAVALGQVDRARDALLFFGEHPAGPGAVYAADGTADTHNPPGDGLPYYILQLNRYWRATGDAGTLRRVWAPTCRVLERLLAERDPAGDGLLNWHAACNVFLYQADHLNLPGAAASPSLMLAGMLERMAEMADSLGESHSSSAWRQRSGEMLRKAVAALWREDEGRFLSGVDPHGLEQRAAYYTDYVFPQLYTSLPAAYGRRSLEALDRDLWIGDHLLRTGSYRPDFFGNNAVHHTALCEGAEAYFRAGRSQRGWALLQGAALGATICTDSPGSFPEYCTTTGWGLADYGFGNDVGVFLEAVIMGLFGFERGCADYPAHWHPAVPATWDRACLRLSGVAMTIAGEFTDRRYSLTVDTPVAMEVRLPLQGHCLAGLTGAAGEALGCEQHDGLVGFTLPLGTEHTFRIRTTAQPGGEPETIIPVQPSLPAGPVRIDGVRVPLPLEPYFNSREFQSANHGIPCRVDCRRDVDAAGFLTVGNSRFRIRPDGHNFMRLALGYWNRASDRLEPAAAAAEVTLVVGRAIRGIEFLHIADARCRLTGVAVARVRLRYAEGSEVTIPLVYGEQIECSVLPFAVAVTRRVLHHDPTMEFPIAVAAFAVPADPARRLEAVSLEVSATDATIGLLAVNLILPP